MNNNALSCQRAQHLFGKTDGLADNYNVIQEVGNIYMKSYEKFSVGEQTPTLLWGVGNQLCL